MRSYAAGVRPATRAIRSRKLKNMFACLPLVLLPLSGCSPDGVTGPELDSASGVTAVMDSGQVTDLAVSAVSDSSVTLAWTEVDDGSGRPATYRLKYSVPPFDWQSGTVGCDRTMAGTQIGARMSCTVQGLDQSTEYEFQVMSYRTLEGVWVGAVYSNVTGGTTAAATTLQQRSPSGIWVERAALMLRPTSGADWQRLLNDAARDPGSADIAGQDSQHDTYTLAAALVCVRTGDYCGKARQGVLDAIGTEDGGRWLAVGRNLGAYVIAADLLDLRAGNATGRDGERVEAWMHGWLTKKLRDNNTTDMRPFGPFHAAANAAAQEGFAFTAVAAYLDDRLALDRAWNAYRRFVCDPGAPDDESINMGPSVRDVWTDPYNPCSVNPKGSTMTVPSGQPGAGGTYRVDGSLPGDMRRGGTYRWQPGYTDYPWVGLEGLIPAAVILERAGYPAFGAADRAVLRTHEYLLWLRNRTGDSRWFDGVRARDIIQLVNHAYGTSFPINRTVGGGRTVGYTGWTHP